MKEKMNEIVAWIKKKKYVCTGVLVAIVLLVVGALTLDIETPKERQQREDAEAQKRQEMLAKLETEDDRTESEVSREAVQPEDATTESVVGGSAAENGQGDSANKVNDAAATERPASQDSSSTMSAGSQQTASTDNSSNNSGTTGSNSGGSVTADSGNSGNSGQNTSGGQSNPDSQNKTDQQPQATPETPTAQPEQEYIAVTVRIVCDNILNHPDLNTTASIPDNGIFCDARTVVKKGETVLDALKAVCADHNISYVNQGSDKNAYISAIGDLKEKECGKYSGWKFKVNGVVSGKSCGNHKLEENDVIEWYYVTTYTQ